MKARRRVAVMGLGLFLFFLPLVSWSQSLTWWVEPATHKVMQDRAPQPAHDVYLEAAKNEYEPFQVVLRADGGDLSNVDARMSDLAGPEGAVIPSANVTLYRAYYVTVTHPSGNSGLGDGVAGNPRAAGEYVDPLIPFFDPYHDTHYAVGTPFSITKNRLQPIFGDVYVPGDAVPGLYQGTLRVTVSLLAVAEVPVTLKVWNFAIPKERRTATSYGFSFGVISGYHSGPEIESIIKNYEETLHNFRIDITNPLQGPPGLPTLFNFDGDGNLQPPDYSAYDSYLQARLDGSYWKDGSNAVTYNSGIFAPGNDWWPGNISTEAQKIAAAADFARHLKEKGFWDHIYVYVHDEPYLYPGALDAVAYDVILMDMGDPEWKTRMMATNHWVAELEYVIGIWSPLTTNYDQWNSSLPQYKREDYQKLIARGDQLWFYVCNGTKPPYAGYDIDTIYGHEPRIVHWSSWFEGATGFLFWHTNYWMSGDPWRELSDWATWPTMARNGDGFLFYPGDNHGSAGAVWIPPELTAAGGLDGPVISHRLMMIREGMEDWDYLLLAEDRGGQAFAKKLTQKIYTQFGINPLTYDPANPPWSYDENELYEVRRELAAWLSAGSAGPAEKSGWGKGSGGGCSLAPDRENRGPLSLVWSWLAILGLSLLARKHRRGKACLAPTLALILLTILVTACGKGKGDEDTAPKKPPLPLPVDHAFVNGVSAPGEAPADLHPDGPVVNAMAMGFSGRSVAIQGQVLSFNVSFSHPDLDLSDAALLIQVLGEDEYWTFDSDQFGGILGSTAIVRVELSKYFEPGAYILRIGLRDNAGHLAGFYQCLLIVMPYVTPEIVTFVPADGAAAVPLNAAIRAVFSDPVVGDTPTLTLSQNGQPVPGVISILPNMKGINLVPNDFLLPNSEYVATLTIGELLTGGVKQEVHHFTTGAISPAPNLTGRVYSIVLGPANIIEPAGAEMIFTAVPIPPILIKIKTFDEIAQTVSSVGTLALEDPLRPNPDLPNLLFPGGGAVLINPYFTMGPSVMVIDLYALSGGMFDVAVNIYGFQLSGRFSPSGDRFEFGTLTGYIDADEVDAAIGQFMPGPIPFSICVTLPDACDADHHLAFRAENLSGPYQPSLGDFHDLTVAVNPATVPASGGIVAVSGQYLFNGDPEGTHTVDLTTTQGTLSCGGAACAVSTASGLYSATLTVPAGLPAGTQITVTASSSSPLGTLNRNKKVLVQ